MSRLLYFFSRVNRELFLRFNAWQKKIGSKDDKTSSYSSSRHVSHFTKLKNTENPRCVCLNPRGLKNYAVSLAKSQVALSMREFIRYMRVDEKKTGSTESRDTVCVCIMPTESFSDRKSQRSFSLVVSRRKTMHSGRTKTRKKSDEECGFYGMSKLRCCESCFLTSALFGLMECLARGRETGQCR